MFLTNAYIKFDKFAVGEELFVLSEDGRLEPHMLRGAVTTPLFRHGGASSWHSWDAAVIVGVGRYWRLVLLCCAVVGGLGVWVFVGVLRRRVAWESKYRSLKELVD